MSTAGTKKSVTAASSMPPLDSIASVAPPTPSPPAEIAQTQDPGRPEVGAPSPDGVAPLAAPAIAREASELPSLSRADEAKGLWRTAQHRLGQEINPHTFDTWIRPLVALGFNGNGALVLRLPTKAHVSNVAKKWQKQVEQAVGRPVVLCTQPDLIAAPGISAAEEGATAAALGAAEKPASGAMAESRGEKCPALPDAASYGLSKEYIELCGPRTEASHNYHLASFLSAVGACLGRRVFIEKAGRHYANLFVVLVGKSGGARKGTALNFGIDLARALEPKIGIVESLDSREGFLEHLAELGKAQADRAGVSAILHLGELRSLIEKTRMEGLGNIVPMLCQAYDCPPELVVHTRKNPISVPRPTVSLAAATTRRWMEGLQEKDLEGGLGNRIMWVPGEPGEAIPNPPDLDRRRWAALTRELRKWIARWPKKGSTRFSFSPAAETRWETIYAELYAHHDDDPLIAILCERLQNHCLKVALIFAALDGQAVIELPHLEAAYAFTQFLYHALWYLFRGFGMSPMAKLDAKIVKLVTDAGPEGIRLPHLKKRFWREDMELFNRRLNHLTVTDGPLVRVTNGRKVILAVAVS